MRDDDDHRYCEACGCCYVCTPEGCGVCCACSDIDTDDCVVHATHTLPMQDPAPPPQGVRLGT